MMIVKLLKDFTSFNVLLLKSLCTFLSRVAAHSDTNRMTSKQLSIIFLPLISPFQSELKMSSGVTILLEVLIDNPDWIPKKQHPNFVKSNIVNATTLADVLPTLLLTEEVQWEIEPVSNVGPDGQIPGSLFISNYRMIFHPKSRADGTARPDIHLPLASILQLEKKGKEKNELIIKSKNILILNLIFSTMTDCQNVYEYIKIYTPPQSLHSIFAYTYGLFYERKSNITISHLNEEEEYRRQGVAIPEKWRIFAYNSVTGAYNSNPRRLLIPTSLWEDIVKRVAKTYHHGCLPTLVYQYHASLACLLRSTSKLPPSQLQSSNSLSNLKLATSHYSPRQSLGEDAVRELKSVQSSASLTAALQQHASKGKDQGGSPSISNPISDINNDIKIFNDAVQQILPDENLQTIVCLRPEELTKVAGSQKNRTMFTFTDTSRVYATLREYLLSGSSSSSQMSKSAIQEWTTSLCEVMLSSVSIALNLQRGESILIEDSGYTNYVVISLILMMIDPFYRTIDGFIRLIEHVWIRFGFPFANATGLDRGNSTANEIGYFVQFIDTAWQIVCQFPLIFEFNEDFLLHILNSMFSVAYGTFIGNTEEEAFNNLTITVSLWEEIKNQRSDYMNGLYVPSDISPLIPDASGKKIFFWSGYFMQWSSLDGRNHAICKIEESINQKVLDLSHLLLPSVPGHYLRQQYQLQEIDLSSNLFHSFPLMILTLTELRSINLSENGIQFIPEGIFAGLQNLSNLESLDLRQNKLNIVDYSISILTSLKTLRLGGSGLSTCVFPDCVTKMKQLSKLDIEHFLLFQVPEGMNDLSNLQHLSLAMNKLTSFRFSSPTLLSLDLSKNEIRELDIKHCSQLQSLDVSFNQLAHFPKSITYLNNLIKLNLQNNQIKRIIPFIKRMSKLTYFDISNNQLRVILPLLGQMESLENVKYAGNHLEFPPSHIVGKGSEVLLEYLRDRMSNSVPLRRVRVYLVGQENVGKSSLSHYLITKTANPVNLSTDGIKINEWKIKIKKENLKQAVDVRIWDFAGQELYYDTHNLFIGDHSIYIIVWNIMHDENNTKIRFWIELIKARASNSPVILVATHIDNDLCTSEYLQRTLQTIANKYANKYPFIKKVIGVSCMTGIGVKDLKEIIKAQIIEQKYIGNFVPLKYLFFEDELIHQRKERVPPLINLEKFTKYAKLFSIEGEEMKQVIQNFRMWGTIHYNQDDYLKDMIIIDPAYLISIMATISTTKHRVIKNGILKHSDLHQIWHYNEYPKEVHHKLLQLCQKFEVTYALDATGKYKLNNLIDNWESGISLVPSLLPIKRPKSILLIFPYFENVKQYSRVYEFNFIPSGFINHLIIRIMYLLKDYHYWRYGICGYFIDKNQNEDAKLLLELVPDELLLKITVRSASSPVKFFLNILDIIDSFINHWFQLEVKIYIPCPHCYENKIINYYLFSYDLCKEKLVSNQYYIDCLSFGNQLSPVRLDLIVPDLSMVEVKKIEYNDIQIDKEIGKGGYATVYKAVYRGKVIALKQIDVIEGKKLQLAYDDFIRETWIMSGIKHHNIIKFYGLCKTPLCILTDFAACGNLFDFLHTKTIELKLQAEQIKLKLKIAYDVAAGMNFLHNRIPAIIHGDLKSPNILLHGLSYKDKVVAVIADFGLSKSWVPVLHGRHVDNPVWLAPEILSGKPYSESADIYAYGVILYEIITLNEFFSEYSFLSAMEDAIIAGKRPLLPQSNELMFIKLYELIQSCWSQNEDERPRFGEILTILKDLISFYNYNDINLPDPNEPYVDNDSDYFNDTQSNANDDINSNSPNLKVSRRISHLPAVAHDPSGSGGSDTASSGNASPSSNPPSIWKSSEYFYSDIQSPFNEFSGTSNTQRIIAVSAVNNQSDIWLLKEDSSVIISNIYDNYLVEKELPYCMKDITTSSSAKDAPSPSGNASPTVPPRPPRTKSVSTNLLLSSTNSNDQFKLFSSKYYVKNKHKNEKYIKSQHGDIIWIFHSNLKNQTTNLKLFNSISSKLIYSVNPGYNFTFFYQLNKTQILAATKGSKLIIWNLRSKRKSNKNPTFNKIFDFIESLKGNKFPIKKENQKNQEIIDLLVDSTEGIYLKTYQVENTPAAPASGTTSSSTTSVSHVFNNVHCFSGSELVNWLATQKPNITDRSQLVQLAQSLLDEHQIIPIGRIPNENPLLLDNDNKYYKIPTTDIDMMITPFSHPTSSHSSNENELTSLNIELKCSEMQFLIEPLLHQPITSINYFESENQLWFGFGNGIVAIFHVGFYCLLGYVHHHACAVHQLHKINHTIWTTSDHFIHVYDEFNFQLVRSIQFKNQFIRNLIKIDNMVIIQMDHSILFYSFDYNLLQEIKCNYTDKIYSTTWIPSKSDLLISVNEGVVIWRLTDDVTSQIASSSSLSKSTIQQKSASASRVFFSIFPLFFLSFLISHFILDVYQRNSQSCQSTNHQSHFIPTALQRLQFYHFGV